jgi:hypothetical protein
MEYIVSASSYFMVKGFVAKYGKALEKFHATFEGKPLSEVKSFEGFSSVKITINSLEELNDFTSTFGNVIYSKNEIEIYDAYRE